MKRLTVILLLLLNAMNLFSQVAHHNADANNKVSGSVHVGDVITFANNSKGVVFYINPDRTGGWVVRSTDNTQTTPWWSTSGPNVECITDVTDIKELLKDVNGYDHTAQIRSSYGTTGSYAASNSIIDFSNGWYIPAAGQLRKLYSMVSVLENMGIPAADFTKLDTLKDYWSSTERAIMVHGP